MRQTRIPRINTSRKIASRRFDWFYAYNGTEEGRGPWTCEFASTTSTYSCKGDIILGEKDKYMCSIPFPRAPSLWLRDRSTTFASLFCVPLLCTRVTNDEHTREHDLLLFIWRTSISIGVFRYLHSLREQQCVVLQSRESRLYYLHVLFSGKPNYFGIF